MVINSTPIFAGKVVQTLPGFFVGMHMDHGF